MVYLSNAFSLQMQGDNDCTTKKCSLNEAKGLVFGLVPGPYVDRETERDGGDLVYAITARSCVGHADIAAVLSGILGATVPANRVSVSLQPGDTLVVGQYVGPRLPEGCTALPDGARIEWYVVSCREAGSTDRLDEMRRDFYDGARDLEWDNKTLLEAVEKHFPQFFDPESFE